MTVDLVPLIKGLQEGDDGFSPFPHTQFPYPVLHSLFGQSDAGAFLKQTQHLPATSLEEQLAVLLGLAEVSEAGQPDREKFFIGDRELRARLVGVNTSTGWALVWGGDREGTGELCRQLQDSSFQVFAVLPHGQTLPGSHKLLGHRPTSAVYFYQAILRYPHIYGRVSPADRHALLDFIEDYAPGVMFLAGDSLSPLEEGLFLAGLSLGIPAVVPPAFSSPYGKTMTAHSPQEAVSLALTLPNLRVRHRLQFQLNLPFPVDPSFASEEVGEGPAIGSTPLSSFLLTNQDKGDGMAVEGEMAPDVAIEVAVGDPRVDLTMTDYLEEFAARLPGYISGVSAQFQDGCPLIRWRSNLPLRPEHLAQVIYHGLKAHFKVEPVRVSLVFLPRELGRMKEAAAAFRQQRQQAIAGASEATESYFWGCARCHSFALEHTCTITPQRPPQCSSRTWMHIKARAYLSDYDSWGWGPQREVTTLHELIDKGRCLDPEKGEYEGVNRYTVQRTGGRTQRVFLHSLSGYPHTACSCFQGVAFLIPGVDGIGIIDRSFKGQTPDGRSWDEIANAVAGKQSPGYAAMGYEYLDSPRFLQGEGGWGKVVWMPRRLKERYAADKPWIATEEAVKDLAELKGFLQGTKLVK